MAALCAWLAASPAAAQAPRLESETYPVSGFDIEYALDAPGQPDTAELLATEVELRVGRDGLLPPHPMAENVRFPLGAVPPGSRFHAGALRQVNRVLLEEFTRRGIGGVLVTMPDLDERTGVDRRAPGDTRIRVLIWTGRVEEVSTLADGERFSSDSLAERTNRPEHAWIREDSPVTAGGERALLRPQEIEDYAALLSRQPGRRVSPVLRPGELQGATRLEYHVAEQKPWLAYAQVSNTGTEATSDWRERFGFSHTQLTGHDDVLRFDYITDFDSVHAIWGEYGAPIFRTPRLRWRVDGSWNDYDSSEVGISEVDFTGNEWSFGGRLDANIFQHRDLFVDVFAMAHWNRIHVDNSIEGQAGSNFFMPGGGIAAERVGEVWSLGAELGVSGNLADFADTDNGDSLDNLGRTDADRTFTMMTWHAETAFYPLTLLRRASWSDEGELGPYDFVQELAFETLGQVTFSDKRLVPQLQQVAGGLYTVRGYEQSVTAGDTVAIVRAEYRLHLPRLLEPSVDAPVVPLLGTFRVRPENAFSFPDWDLIARAFFDGARVLQYEKKDSLEHNAIIHSLGFGGELRLSRYFSASLDVAWPQRRLNHNDPELEKPRLHGVITVLY
jgi:hemolysin activation/secretion protein